MNKAEFTAKLEAIDKELLPLFAKNGQAEKQLWYYTGCLDALSREWGGSMLICFANAVGQLRNLVGEEN